MEKKRYHLMDEVRGFAVLCMVFFHGFYSVNMVLGSSAAYRLITFFMPAEPYFAALFLFISGISSTLSSSNLKNALRLSGVAVAISAVTILGTELLDMEMAIYFGIIHLIAVCLFLAAALDKIKIKWPAVWLVISLAIFLVAYDLVYGYPFLPFMGLSRLGVRMPYGYEGMWWLLPFGFPEPSTPYMADYFPVLPWLFMFLMGRFSANMGRGKLPRFMEKKIIPPLGYLGRHSLIIYVLHQPIIFGLCYIILALSGGSI